MTSLDHPPRPLAGIALAAVLLFGAAAQAQTQVQPPAAPPAAAPSEPAAAPTTPPPARPGFLDAFGKLIEQSVTGMNSAIGQWNENTKGATEAAKSAAGGLVALPAARMVAGRERCDIAPNGAPDCAGAVTRLCKANNLATGRSMDVETAETCPAATLLARRYGQPEPAACRMESFVTKAMCQ